MAFGVCAGLGDLPVRLDRGVCMPVPILLQPAGEMLDVTESINHLLFTNKPIKFIAIAITIATPCWILHSVFCSLVQVPCIKALCFLSSDPRGQFVPLSGDCTRTPCSPHYSEDRSWRRTWASTWMTTTSRSACLCQTLEAATQLTSFTTFTGWGSFLEALGVKFLALVQSLLVLWLHKRWC